MSESGRRVLAISALGLAGLMPGLGMATDAGDSANFVLSPKGGLGVKTVNGRFAIGLHGFIQIDGAVYDDDVTELGNGADIRNAKLIIKGKVFADWGYKFQLNFAADGKKQLQDMFVQYLGFKPIMLRAGNFKVPFSLQFLNGQRHSPFMELAMIQEALVPKRRIGAQIASHSGSYTAQLGVFANKVTQDAPGQDSGLGVVARGVVTPIHDQRRLLLLGLAGQYRHLGDYRKVAIKSRPVSHVTSTRLVGFGPGTVGGLGPITDAQELAAGDLQAAVVYGPLAIQGEYVVKHVERRGPAFNGTGGYVQASYFLTGESRAAAYKAGKGAFGGIKPIHNYGAWQVALRYDWLDLTDAGIDGGRQHNITAALNWYANKFVRFGLNYVRADADYPNGPDNEINIVQVRAQVGF